MNKLPFRWDLSKPEQLGSLIRSEHFNPDNIIVRYSNELVSTAETLLVKYPKHKLVFVGRSAENIYDYLKGKFSGTTDARRILHLNISLYFSFDYSDENKQSLISIGRELFSEAGVSPRDILLGEPTVFIDMVASGGTYDNIHTFLNKWATDEGINTKMLRKRIYWCGLLPKQHNSPNTYRWHQQKDWCKQYKPGHFYNISLSAELLYFIANGNTKLTSSNPPEKWGVNNDKSERYTKNRIVALANALLLFEKGVELGTVARIRNYANLGS